MNNSIYNIALILTIIGGLNWGADRFVRLRRRGFFGPPERFEPYRTYICVGASGGTHFSWFVPATQIVGYQKLNDTSEVKFKKKNLGKPGF